jgi:uncharacterized protein (TIGR00725 family)
MDGTERIMAALRWNAQENLLQEGGRTFDPARLQWLENERENAAGVEVSPLEALKKLATRNALKRVPIGIIGPREATIEQREVARTLGAAMAQHGLQLLCGGKNGVMEAACEGHAAAGGLPIGILPDEEWQAANPFVAIPIATGIGPARNAIIARACVALIAVGGGVGTLSEMALGLQFNRLVLAMAGAPLVDGVPVITSVEDALDRVARRLLQVV